MPDGGVRGPLETSARRKFLEIFRRETSTKTKLNFMAIAIASALATAFIVTVAGLNYVEKIHIFPPRPAEPIARHVRRFNYDIIQNCFMAVDIENAGLAAPKPCTKEC